MIVRVLRQRLKFDSRKIPQRTYAFCLQFRRKLIEWKKRFVTKELIQKKIADSNTCHCRTVEEPTNKRMTYREMQMILRQEGGEDGDPVDCCPTIEEMVEPVGGRNRQDMYVELYRDGENAQRFFEYSCRPDVLDKPCRFVDRKLSNQSRCVQKFSYTYAIVENPGSKVWYIRESWKFSIKIPSLRDNRFLLYKKMKYFNIFMIKKLIYLKRYI